MAAGDLDPNTCEDREKYWSELDDKQKMERMREQVKYLHSDNRRLKDLVTKLRDHSHHENGQLLIPLDDRGPMMEVRSGREDSDKVYF